VLVVDDEPDLLELLEMTLSRMGLDTTRADAIGPEQHNVESPSFNALAKRGMRFRYAYATVPQTLPSACG